MKRCEHGVERSCIDFAGDTNGRRADDDLDHARRRGYRRAWWRLRCCCSRRDQHDRRELLHPGSRWRRGLELRFAPAGSCGLARRDRLRRRCSREHGARLAPPAEQLLRRQSVPAGDLRDVGTRLGTLEQNARLLLARPPPPTHLAGDQFDPPDPDDIVVALAGLRFKLTLKRMVKSIAHGSASSHHPSPAETWGPKPAYNRLRGTAIGPIQQFACGGNARPVALGLGAHHRHEELDRLGATADEPRHGSSDGMCFSCA